MLSHANLLPIALQANSIDELLNSDQSTEAELRDLCLRLENPVLQEVRDACADLGRRDEPDENESSCDENDSGEEEAIKMNRHFRIAMRRD